MNTLKAILAKLSQFWAYTSPSFHIAVISFLLGLFAAWVIHLL